MSNYRRLISYIYAYEGGVKGKNIGFAKLEARNGQCKIQVNVKKVYVGNSDMGVWLLGGDKEIFLGNIFIRSGAGEFRTAVTVMNVENSGQTMDQCYGLTIHSVEDSWQCYTTIWEDAVARAAEVGGEGSDAVEQAAEIVLEDVTAGNLERKAMEKAPEAAIPEMKTVEMSTRHKSSIVEEIEAEIQAQGQMEGSIPANQPQQKKAVSVAEAVSAAEATSVAEAVSAAETGTGVEVGDREMLEQLEKEEAEANQPDRLWNYFRKTYPKIQAFDYVNGCEILTIKPQDIGLLPRETWTYGNNSFLLHGYYNYRYLLLAKLHNPQGCPRYLLGVPGHYYSNEKYMASMFGFPSFVLSKMQTAGDGRFGYWYTDINMGNQ